MMAQAARAGKARRRVGEIKSDTTAWFFDDEPYVNTQYDDERD
jgi:hypothetical protein